MSVVITSGGGSGGNVVSDLVWEVNGPFTEATAEAQMSVPVPFGNRDGLLNAVQTLPFQILTGGVSSVVRDAASGTRMFSITSGVGQRTTRVHTGNLVIPSGQQQGIGTVVPTWRRSRRYTAGIICRWPVRGATILEVGLFQNNGGLTLLGTSPAFVLSSDPGVNAGQWTPRFRTVDAGAITTLSSTGLSPNIATHQRYEVRYTEGPSPLLELLIDGQVVGSLGLTTMPQAPATQTSFHFGVGCSAAAGTTLEYVATTYKVEQF